MSYVGNTIRYVIMKKKKKRKKEIKEKKRKEKKTFRKVNKMS